MQYKIYVPSRGRYDPTLVSTGDFFLRVGIPFTMVVEQKEYDQYCARFGKEVIHCLPGSDYGCVAFVRNYIKDLSAKRGEEKHWQVDDDIKKMWVYDGKKANYSHSPLTILGAAEHFIGQFQNVALSSLNSNTFARLATTLYGVNNMCYACFLVNNNAHGFRFREQTIDDVDYNLQVLSKGWCTVQFKKMVYQWQGGQTQIGGLTDLRSETGYRRWIDNTLAFWPHLIPGTTMKKGGTGYRLRTERVWRKFTQRPIPVPRLSGTDPLPVTHFLEGDYTE